MKRIALLLLTLLLAHVSPGQPVTCTLKGKVVGRDSRMLMLTPETEDRRFTVDSVPIVNGIFTYVMKIPHIIRYELVFLDEYLTGASRPVGFFPCNGTVEFTLYPMNDADRDVVRGGALNRERNDFDRRCDSVFRPMFRPWIEKLDSLRKTGGEYSEKAKEVEKRYAKAKDDSIRDRLRQEMNLLRKGREWYSAEGNRLNNAWDSIARIKMYWTNDFIRGHIDLFSYSLIYRALEEYSYNPVADIPFINDVFPLFRRKFNGHPYTGKVAAMLNAINKLKIGQPFIDFEAPTLDGKMVRLSDSIRGRVALIDLWASWCGSCRRLAVSTIPIYNKYRDKGFTIVGVACEYGNTGALKTALKNDRYPWLNLVEMDNRLGIWAKYNIVGAGGSTFLVDRDGKIVAIHPTAEELDKLLEQMLKQTIQPDDR